MLGAHNPRNFLGYDISGLGSTYRRGAYRAQPRMAVSSAAHDNKLEESDSGGTQPAQLTSPPPSSSHSPSLPLSAHLRAAIILSVDPLGCARSAVVGRTDAPQLRS